MNVSEHSILIIVIIGACALLAGVTTMQRMKRKTTQREGVQLLQAGRRLLNRFQIHRGLTAKFLSGENEMSSSILTLREDISAEILRLSELNEWLRENDDWHGITQHWARLASNSFTMDADRNFDQHCRLVTATLALMTDIADKFRVEKNGVFDVQNADWHKLLQLSEKLGQCRALGVRMLRLGSANLHLTKHRVFIGNNVTAITALLAEFDGDQQLQATLGEFLAYMKRSLLNEKEISVEPVDFFKAASNVIELVYELFDKEMSRLYQNNA